jgi:hypothetical protein
MTTETHTWPELAEALYERLTGRGAQISYTYEDFEIDVPSSTGDDAKSAHWKLNGTLKISTSEG